MTRQLYDTIEDAHTHDKKGLIVGVDFEKAFDSLSHDFIKQVLKIMGFDTKLLNWVEGVRHPKFSPKQAAAGPQGSGGR